MPLTLYNKSVIILFMMLSFNLIKRLSGLFSGIFLNKKFVLLITFFALLVFSGVKVSAGKINIEKLNFELGVKSLKQENLQEAIKYFNLVLNKNPDNIEAHYNIAVAYKKMGSHEQSLKHFDRVVKLLNSPSRNKPEIMTVTNVNQKRNQDEIPDRFDIYTEVKEKENDYIDLADMHADNGQHEAAIEYYNLALKINPYNDNTYFKICKGYMESNNPLDAEPYIKKAVELSPNNPRYEYYLEKVSSKIAEMYGNDYRKKEDLVLKNFSKKDSSEKFKQKDYEKELYREDWLADNPDKDAGAPDIAFKQDNPGNREKARIKDYYKDKDNQNLLYELSQQGQENFSHKRSQELDYLDLGDLHFDNQEYETAVDYYKMAQHINPNNDYTYYKLSRSYIELKNYAKADNYIEKALNLSGKNRKYVYFKNRITDRITRQEAPAEDEFYQPAGQTVYIDEIAREPEKKSEDDFLIKKPSAFNRFKSAVSAVKMPDFKMPGNSGLSKKNKNPLEGKVQKFSESQKEKKKKYSGEKRDEEVFSRPSGYYEVEEKQPESDVAKYNPDKPGFQEPVNPAKRSQKLYTANYYNRKGVEFFKNDNLEKAEEYFKKAIQLKPVFSKAYNNLANIEVKRKNLKKAEKYALKSVKIDPELPEGYYNLSLINKKQGDFDSEIHYLNKTVSVDPKYYEAYFARGLAYYNRGNYEKAKYNFNETLRFKHDHFLASQNLGIIYANELNYEQAEKYLNLAVKLDKNSPQAYFHLAVVRKNSGKIFSAIEDFQKSIELNPSNYKSYIMLSKCYDMDSQPQKALKVLKDAAEKNSENAEIYNYLGLLNLKFNKYEQACLAFRKAVEKNPQRAIYYYNLSQCYLTMGNRKNSNYAFQRAVSIIPASVQDYTDLAEIFLDRGMASYAVRVLKDGISKLNDNEYLFLVLSDFYERTGAINAAKEILEQYLRKNGEESTFGLLVRRRLNKLESL